MQNKCFHSTFTINIKSIPTNNKILTYYFITLICLAVKVLTSAKVNIMNNLVRTEFILIRLIAFVIT